jgi:hypothetical protein
MPPKKKKILKEEIWEVISEKFMEKILDMVNQNVQDALKKFQGVSGEDVGQRHEGSCLVLVAPQDVWARATGRLMEESSGKRLSSRLDRRLGQAGPGRTGTLGPKEGRRGDGRKGLLHVEAGKGWLWETGR